MYRKLSDIHRYLHRSTLDSAKRSRRNGAQHARLMALAAVSRFYFARYRSLGD